MVSRLYLHNAASPVGGTLPATKQSAQTVVASNSASVNKTMTTTIGTTQTSSSIANVSGYNYFTRFVAAPLAAQTISANTWTINFAASQSSSFAASNIRACIYVWRPSSGTRVGFIADSVVALTTQFTSGEFSYQVTVAGSAVTAIAGDVLCFEAILSTSSSSGTLAFYYDGATINTTDGSNVSDQASFIETPQNNLIDSTVATTVTSKVVTNKI